MNFIRLQLLLALLFTLITLPAHAEDPVIQSMAAYKGADRMQKLIAAAKKEGSVTIYTSISSAVAQKMSVDFEAKYGVKVKLWRAGDAKVLQRVLSERSANRPAVDVINMGSAEMEMAHREKLLESFKSPLTNALIPGAVSSDNDYVATFVNIMVQAYNTNNVKKEELPKTYQDLLDPKWKGRLGLEVTDGEWFYNLVNYMGEEKGLKYFRDLMAINSPSLRTGHSLLGNMVSSGEVPLGITVYSHTALSAKKSGAPVDYIILEPAIAVSFSMGLSNQAVNPNAALLFYEYMLTDGQRVFANADYLPTLKDIDTPFKNVRYRLTSQPAFLDQYDKWDKLWDNIVLKK